MIKSHPIDMEVTRFQSLSDEELCQQISNGCREAEDELVLRYGQLVRDTAFRTYAEICIRSRLITAVRAAQGGKHSPLNHSISFEPPLFDGTNAQLFSIVESPEDVIIGREELKERLDALKGQLSELEANILPLYLNGLSCGEIAKQVDRSQKSVDNAIQRIRRKMAR